MDKNKQCSDSAQGGIGVKKAADISGSVKKASVGAKSDASGQTQSSSRGKDNG